MRVFSKTWPPNIPTSSHQIYKIGCSTRWPTQTHSRRQVVAEPDRMIHSASLHTRISGSIIGKMGWGFGFCAVGILRVLFWFGVYIGRVALVCLCCSMVSMLVLLLWCAILVDEIDRRSVVDDGAFWTTLSAIKFYILRWAGCHWAGSSVELGCQLFISCRSRFIPFCIQSQS